MSWHERLDRPGDRSPQTGEPTQPPELPAPVQQSLRQLGALVQSPDLPGSVAVRLQRYLDLVTDTLPRLSLLGPGQQAGFDAVAITTDYLPAALDGYLRLPRAWADSRPLDAGRTALMVLIDQLDLVVATITQVQEATCRADAEALLLHGRFLAERLDPSSRSGPTRERGSGDE